MAKQQLTAVNAAIVAEQPDNANKWTDEQREAIRFRGGNLLVSAAAGAGKTAVLIERIVGYITDPENPIDIDRLLVLTFTNAAASEMRERLGTVLAERLDKEPGNRRLNRQTSLLNLASIGTIHSFCLEVIRQHFYLLGLDPGFRIAAETEAELLQGEVLETLFEERYAAADPTYFHRLVDCYGGKRDDAALQTLVLEIYELARSTPKPEEWLEELPRYYAAPEDAAFDDLPWCNLLKQGLKITLPGLADLLNSAIRLAGGAAGPGAYLDALTEERDQLVNLVKALEEPQISWDELGVMLAGVEFNRLKAARGKEVDPEIKKQVKDLRDEVKKQIDKIAATYYSRESEELNADLRINAPLVAELAQLVKDFTQAYKNAKTERGLVDFSDLEHCCLQVLTADVDQPEKDIIHPAEEGEPLSPNHQPETVGADIIRPQPAAESAGAAQPAPKLKPSPVAQELRRRYVEVLVDEYQDINPVQEAILNLVSRQEDPARPPNLFMVGDVKQSIYKFRLADPGLFLEKHRNYSPAPGHRERRIELTKNFRSRRGVVSAVNYLFRQLMRPEVSGLIYDKSAELAYGANYPAESPANLPDAELVELYLCGKEFEPEQAAEVSNFTHAASGSDPADAIPTEGDPADEDPEILDAAQREARLIASRINELIGNNPEKSAPHPLYNPAQKVYRRLEYRDIAVLMRSPAGYAQVFVDEFRALGVPVYAETSGGYFAATEVETILSLLKVIDNPRQDIPLAGVLRSPLAGLDAAALAEIRLYQPKGDFYEATLLAAQGANGNLAQKLGVFLERLAIWRDSAGQGELAGLIWRIYRETGYYNFVGGLPGGGQRQANLRALLERARQYEDTGFRGLFLFLRYIQRMRESGRDLGTAKILPEKANVVRLMSIHKSKGLEYPVVFVAGLGRQFNQRDLQRQVLLHKDLGLGLQHVDPELRLTYPTIAKTAIKHILKMESLAEELRILYVAMTRAKEKLILVGSVTNLKTKISKWGRSLASAGEFLPDSETAAAGCFLDWIMPVMARHRDGFMIGETVLSNYVPPPEIAEDPSQWRMVFQDDAGAVFKAGEYDQELFAKVRRLEELEPVGDSGALVEKRLTWRYPHQVMAGYSAKTTVTELKRRFSQVAAEEEGSSVNTRPAFDQRPRFLQKQVGLNATEKGTALHLVMQNLDLNQVGSVAAISAQITGMLGRELLTPEQAKSTSARRILNFWQNPLGQRVLKGNIVYREKPFTIAIPAYKIYADIEEDAAETVLVQGVIDCLVDEGDGFLLLDFKTDRVAKDRLDNVVDGYRVQLEIYAGAVESIYGKKVKSRYLYFLNRNLAVEC